MIQLFCPSKITKFGVTSRFFHRFNFPTRKVRVIESRALTRSDFKSEI